MYSLNTIHRINAQAASAPARETETTRRCSYCEQPDGAVILHSARQRSTAYLNPEQGKRFLAEWLSTNSQEKKDFLVETYFNTVPVGKQQIVNA